MFSIDEKRAASSHSGDEAFRQSFAALSQHLANRKVETPPEFPIAPNDAGAPASSRRWLRPTIIATLIVAVLSGFYALRSTLPPPAEPQGTRQQVSIPAPTPPIVSSSPTTKDFATPVTPAEVKQVPSPAPGVGDRPAGELGPLKGQDMREVQSRLQSMGFTPGPIDGISGPLTQSAVRRYEESKGRTATGRIDGDLLRQLRQEGGR